MWSQVGEKFDNSLNLMPIIFSRGGRKDTEKGLGLGNLNRLLYPRVNPSRQISEKGKGKAGQRTTRVWQGSGCRKKASVPLQLTSSSVVNDK